MNRRTVRRRNGSGLLSIENSCTPQTFDAIRNQLARLEARAGE